MQWHVAASLLPSAFGFDPAMERRNSESDGHLSSCDTGYVYPVPLPDSCCIGRSTVIGRLELVKWVVGPKFLTLMVGTWQPRYLHYPVGDFVGPAMVELLLASCRWKCQTL